MTAAAAGTGEVEGRRAAAAEAVQESALTPPSLPTPSDCIVTLSIGVMPDTCHLAESASETAAVRSHRGARAQKGPSEVSKWAELKPV